MKKMTIKDIARELNISIGTVDRALHNRGRISEKTRLAVIDKAKEFGYEVNVLAQSLSRNRVIKIACVFPGEYVYFYPDLEMGIVQAQKSLKDFNVLVNMYKSERLGYEKEIGFLQNLKKEGIDGLAMCPGHRTKLNDIINEIVEQGIPVVTMATDAPESKRMTCVSTDSFNNGQIAGELMAQYIRHKGKVAVFTGSHEVTDHQEKIRGFMDVIYSYPNAIQVVGTYETFDSEKLAYESVIEVIGENPDLSGVYINTVNNASACKAVEDSRKAGELVVIGTDLTRENMPYIENGTMQSVIFQDPYRQGYNAVKILYDVIAGGQWFGPNNYIKPDIINKYNLKYFTCYS